MHSVEYFVEKPVSDAHSSFGDKHDLEYFFILILNHIVVALLVEPWLHRFHEINQELPHLLVLKNVLVIAWGVVDVLRDKVRPILVKEICEEVVNNNLTLDVVWQLVHESEVCFGLDS